MFERSQQGAVDVLSGRSPLNAEYAPAVEKLLAECMRSGQPRIVFNLQDVPLIDSTGLELLLDSRDRCGSRGGAMRLAAPGPLCRDILRVTGLQSTFEVFDDVTSALGSFAI